MNVLTSIISLLVGFFIGDIVGRYKEWQEDNDKNKNDNVHN